jgi:serine/threonine protein kinase
MSPEQVRGMPLDLRSDIFAAGVVLHELCTGERLFVGTSDFNVLEKVEQARVPRPSQIEPSIPERLERVILRALTREPADRYQQAGELAAELRSFLAESAPESQPREELARFMRATFPDESAREQATLGKMAAPETNPGILETTVGGSARGAAETDPARAPPGGKGTPVAFKAVLILGLGLALWGAVAAFHARRAGAAAAPTSVAAVGPHAAVAGSPAAPAALGFLSLGSRPPT